MKEVYIFAQKELEEMRARVLDENIPPEQKATLPLDEIALIKKNIFETFGGDLVLEDMENILGNKIPAIQSVNAVISSIQSQETLKLVFLRHGQPIGQIMDPPYMNYNGVYGQFDAIPVLRRPDCVACGQNVGQDNIAIALPMDSTIGDIFKALMQMHLPITKENWMITNPITKSFLYNPMYEKGKTENEKLEKFEIKSGDEVTLTPFGKDLDKAEIKQYNIVIQLL
jgi:hypothetical protein